eukprot:Clim_evm6s35 gene=Clim_evmTU6s35
MEENILDVVVIGAGPHALAFMSKLLEPRVDPQEEIPQNTTLFKQHRGAGVKARYDNEPAAAKGTSLYKDLRSTVKQASCAKYRARRLDLLQRCMIIDKRGQWMGQWDQQFKALHIPALRSTMSAHPDPVDSNMLHFFADETKRRSNDTVDIDLDRSKAYHGPFEVPSTALFRDCCRSVISRYNLQHMVTKGSVTRIDSLPTNENDTSSPPLLEIHMDNEQPVLARNVVVARGSLNAPAFPHWAQEARERYRTSDAARGSLLHANEVMEFLSSTTNHGVRSRILVVGGGLTAGHLALCALRSRPDVHVTLVARRTILQRQFDLDLEWMGMKRTNSLAEFWGIESMEERAQVLKRSKNGGSMSPEVLRDLAAYAETSQLDIIENTEVVSVEFVEGLHHWTTIYDNGGSEKFDAIWCATGTVLNFEGEDVFANLTVTASKFWTGYR